MKKNLYITAYALMVLFISSAALSDDDPFCIEQLPSGCWKTNDIIDPRIEWHAQAAMMAMFEKGGDDAADASTILCAVKRGELGGIYRNSMMVPIQYAKSVGMNYWDMIPKGTGRNSACFDKSPGKAPLIIFREGIQANRNVLIRELKDAWDECRLDRTVPRCYTVTIPKRTCAGEKWNDIYYSCMGYKKKSVGKWDYKSTPPKLRNCIAPLIEERNDCRAEEHTKKKDWNEFCSSKIRTRWDACMDKYVDKERSANCENKANDITHCEISE